jgi:diguanylate cyclase (GGDEF)-like protein
VTAVTNAWVDTVVDEFQQGPPRERLLRARVWVGVVAALAAVAVVPSFVELPQVLRTGGIEFWLIVAFALAVDIRIFPGRVGMATVTPSLAFTFGLLLGWGLAPAVIVQAVAVVISAIQLHHPPGRAFYNLCRYALSFAAAWGVLVLAGVPRLSEDSIGAGIGVVDVLAIMLAALVWYAVDTVLACTAVSIAFGGGWVDALVRCLRDDSKATLSVVALGPLVVTAGNASPLLVPLMLVPLLVVSELARFTARERRKASVDELTGLPNRRALYGHMRAQARAYGQRSRWSRGGEPDTRRMALLLLDLDQFRRVNEALGHGVGDRLLTAVAQRLREAIGADGIVARLGGDEFAVLAPRLLDQDAVGVLANRIVDALAVPINLDGLPVDVAAAIGVAIYPEHGTDSTTLLRRAEVAMYDAKDHGTTFSVYTPEADEHSPERLTLLADLRRALESDNGELQLHYQPQIDLVSGAVVGTEALLRWRHPDHGFISPDMLIKVAEHTAVMRLITAWVLKEAIRQLAAWRADGHVLRTSVNISARDLHRGELVDELAELLLTHSVTANQLQLEITEGALMADPRRALVTLHRLDKLGVALSLDDFGTGYSSLQHLRRLPLAEVKIDRSFVLGMTTDPDDAAIVTSIIGLGLQLGLRVVAEGVEDEETRRLVAARGCEVGQGWHFARPMAANAFIGWLARYRSAMPVRD